MAELLKLDTRCQDENCNRVDFLPIECDHCKLKFCSDHSNAQNHSCSQIPKNIVSNPGKVDSGELFECSLSHCSKRELTGVNCGFCGVQLCLSHRNQPDHDCPRLKDNVALNPMSKTKELVKNITAKDNKTGVSTLDSAYYVHGYKGQPVIVAT